MKGTLRRHILTQAFDRVVDTMSLRRPQEQALRKFHELLLALGKDLSDLSADALTQLVREQQPQWTYPTDSPEITFELATGVGKTRLMGALIAYLYLAGQSRCFVLLAPRRAILRKTITQTEPGDSKYLFVDAGLLPAVEVWHGGNVERFAPAVDDDRTLQLFIFSPQSFTGDDRLVRRASEFGGTSVLDYISSRKDVIGLVDESHHLGKVANEDTRAWTQAVRDMKPRIVFGLTATPRRGEGVNVLHEYSLQEALRDKLYTKDVRLIVRQRKEADLMSDDDWDHLILDFGLDRLTRKEAAIAAYTGADPLPYIQPVMLVAAENTQHAETVAEWLRLHRGLDDQEILVTHSKRSKTEDEIERLVKIEMPSGNPVRVVINVFELTEGWDVTNVYVVAPLRAMGTYQGAVQTMGRGLRLPAGRRVGDEEIDSLDVICFGRDSLEDILERAVEDYGIESDAESGLGVVGADDDDLDDPPPTKQITIPAQIPGTLSMPQVRRNAVDADLDFDIATVKRVASSSAAELELSTLSIAAAAEGLKYGFDVAVQLASNRVISMLGYLSDPLDGPTVERIVESFLLELGCEPDGQVELDWMAVAAITAEQIDRRYRRKRASYSVGKEVGEVRFGEYLWNVPEEFDAPIPLKTIHAWTRALRRLPISGWKRCTASAASFDSSHELQAARIVDQASGVEWWARNDPPALRIPTPIGQYAPDFVVRLEGEKILLLEIKQSELFEAPESDARVKARAAAAWCAAIEAAKTSGDWGYAIVLDDDIDRATTLEELTNLRVEP